MRFSIITPSYNSGRFLEGTLRSIIAQLDADLEVELIVIDGGSSDQSLEILERYRAKISQLVVEKDHGPANAINKGLGLSSGEIVAWLNADDLYYPGALARVRETMARQPAAPFCFGKCPIIDSEGGEVRTPITRFKEAFYPVSSRFTYQCINYLSQPAPRSPPSAGMTNRSAAGTLPSSSPKNLPLPQPMPAGSPRRL